METKSKPRYLVVYKDGHTDELEPGITEIKESTYYNRDDIISIFLPGSITHIGWGAFKGCIGLKNITIPKNVTHIDNWSFHMCTNLTSITLPNSVTHIGENAFSCCSSLTAITIPNSVTYIGNNAFSDCINLKYTEYENCNYLGNKENPYCVLLGAINKNCSTYTIHNDAKIIYGEAFKDCNSLKSITIPENVTSIGDSAFSGCASLKSITIPGSVTSIGANAFESCNSLKDIYYSGSKADWEKIKIEEDGNEKLTGGTLKHAKIHFNSK